MSSRSEMMMPVSDEQATKLIEIEVLRGINRNLEKLNERSDETLEKMHAMDARLIRIEANKVDRNLEALTKRVDDLEADKDRRDGATGVFNWFGKHGAGLGAMLLGLGFVVYLILKATGKIP